MYMELMGDRGADAIIKIIDSKGINKQHPEAEALAKELLSKYYF